MSEVILTRRARKDLERLDPPSRRRIIEKLTELAAEPLRHAVRLTDPRLGAYRFRIGEWRVIFDVIDDQLVILRIGHRREIYRR
jgi:mRNA interferase RelE/StbE